MNSRVAQCTLAIFVAGVVVAAWGQRGGRGVTAGDPPDPPPPRSIPNGDAARARSEREQNLKDAIRLAELAEKVRSDLAESSSFTLSISTVKDSEEMAKLSKKLHARLKSGNPRPDPTPAGFDASRIGVPPKR